MNDFDDIDLAQFYGSMNYYRLYKHTLLTDGTKYLAEKASCYWLMDAIASHLYQLDSSETFAVAVLVVVDEEAELEIDDGNGFVLAKQHFDYTDFPLPNIKIYCQYSNDNWVLMLPTEY